MRIAHVIHSDGFAGVERHVATLANGQAASGHQVLVIGGNQAAMTSALSLGVEHRCGNSVVDVLRALPRPAQVDVVHTHMTVAELLSAIMARSASTPVISTRHFARQRGGSAVLRAALPMLSGRLAAQISVSRYVAAAIGDKSTVVYPGVQAGEGVQEAPEATVLLLQRLQAEKESAVALRAFANADLPGWRLDVVGRGPQEASLKVLAVDLGIADRVTWHGFRHDVPTLLSKAGMLMAPCRVEGLGLSVLEAMASAVPVVAADAGAYPETVGRAPDSRLFAPGDWRQAADLMQGLAGSAAARVTYGRQLRTVQQRHFTVERQVAGTTEVYRTVLA